MGPRLHINLAVIWNPLHRLQGFGHSGNDAPGFFCRETALLFLYVIAAPDLVRRVEKREKLFVAEGDGGVDAGGAASGEIGGEDGYGEEKQDRKGEESGIVSVDAEEERFEESRAKPGA